MAFSSRLLAAILLPTVGFARLQHLSLDPSDCVQGCIESLQSLQYADIAGESGSCESATFVDSVAFCTKTYCSEQSITPGWDYFFDNYCPGRIRANVNFDKSIASVDGNATQIRTIGNKQNITGTVYPTFKDFSISYHTITAWDQEQIYHQSFGWSMYLLAAIVFAIGITHRTLAYASSAYRSRRQASCLESNSEKPASLNRGPLTSVRTVWRKHVSLPALFGHRTEAPWHICTIPTRLQALFIIIYITLNLVFSFGFIDEGVFNGDLYFGTTAQARWRYITDRTGIIAAYNFPLLFALAGRNNLMIWCTGFSYATMNLLHKWVARMTVLEATVHSVGYTVLYLSAYGGVSALVEEIHQTYFHFGILAILACLFIIPLAILPLRRASYEVFLLGHIVLAVVALIGLWYHLEMFGSDYLNFCWACIGIWASERLFRLARLAILSTRALARKPNATGIIKRQGQMVRLEVETSSPFCPRPGTHYFVYFPRRLNFWENHPFTLASWDEADANTDAPRKLTFLMAVNDGMTGKLAQTISACDGEAALSVLLEGPYGRQLPIRRYETVVFIAGGSGITAIIPYLRDIRRRTASGDDSISTRRVDLVWVAKSSDFVEGVMRKELVNAVSHTAGNLAVKVTVHLTQESAGDSTGSRTPLSTSASSSRSVEIDGKLPGRALEEEKDDDLAVAAKELDDVSTATHTVNFGRPEMSSILHDAIESHAGGRLAVMACGPRGMTDDVRKAVADSCGRSALMIGDNFEYFEESFGW